MDQRVTAALTAIRRILRATEFGARELARQSGLTASQVVVMQVVARRGDPSAGQIAESAGVSQATITVLIDKLEARGLVVRSRDSEDRRRVAVRLTDAGRNLLAQTPDVLQDRFSARFARLADWEQASIIAALERVATMLDADGMDASPILDVGRLDREEKAARPSGDAPG